MKIKLNDIVKIQKLEEQIFEEENKTISNNTTIQRCEGFIYKILRKITDDHDQLAQIYNCVLDNMSSKNFEESIKLDLNTLGYVVV